MRTLRATVSASTVLSSRGVAGVDVPLGNPAKPSKSLSKRRLDRDEEWTHPTPHRNGKTCSFWPRFWDFWANNGSKTAKKGPKSRGFSY
jgi:hypothetical protein